MTLRSLGSLCVLCLTLALTGCSGSINPGGSGGGTGGGAGGGQGTDTQDGGLCTDTWEDYGQVTFTTTCASCHDHDHSNFTTQAGVQAEASLIAQRVSAGQMPMGAELSGADRERLLVFVACGAPSASKDAGFAYEQVSAYTAVAKVKNVLVGLPPTAEEVAAVAKDPKALEGLVDGWMKLPQYQQKMMVFFELAFQQTQITAANFVDLVPTNGLNGAAASMLVQNARESFARTVLALDAQGRPFSDVFTTHQLMMTPALMELYALLDARHADNAGKVIDDWAKAHPDAGLVVQYDAGTVDIAQTVTPGNPNFLHFYDADLPKLTYPDTPCYADPIVLPSVNSIQIHDMLYGQVDGRTIPNPDGGAKIGCPPRGGSLAATQLTPADFTTWKLVTIRQPVGTEAPTVFFDLPTLRAASELVIRTPRLGFFTTPGFQANWTTNQTNQFRVTVNQALIVATGMQYDGLDSTPSPQTPGIDTAHASNSACFACHRLLDPTRAIFSATYSWFYNQATDSALIAQKGLFNFQGQTKSVNTIDDFGAALASHPAVPAAWGQKLCEYINSAPCDVNDPEFVRIVGDFKTGFSWSTLVKELSASAMVTNLSATATYAKNGEVIAVSRRDHLCAALDARLQLNDSCGRTLVLGQKTGIGALPSIVSGLPSDGYGRGSTQPVLPNAPTLFYRAGLENICVGVATQVVDAAVSPTQPNALHWTSAQADKAIDDFTSILIGLPANDPRYPAIRAVLAQHYADAQKSAGKTDSLRSTFVTACLAPTFVGVGL